MTACTVLENGVQILSRSLPGRRAAALGFWLSSGVRHEGPGQSGYAHLLEHVLYRSGGRGCDDLDALGGHINACTSRDLTVFHGFVTATRLIELATRFSEMLLRPCLTERDLQRELPAVMQEMAAFRDDFRGSMEEDMIRGVWCGHAIARPILGDPAHVRNCTAVALRAYGERVLHGSALRIVAAGAVDHDGLVAACRPLSGLPAGAGMPAQRPPRFTSCAYRRYAPGERCQLTWVLPLPAFGSPACAALIIAEAIAAGGTDARLQHELRERLGAVYGVESRLDLYSDCGLWWLRIDCNPGDKAACRRAVESIFSSLTVAGPDRAELLRASSRLHAYWTIEEDAAEQVMERIARESIYLGRVRSLDERLSALAAVTGEQVRSALADSWARRSAFSLLPFSERSAASQTAPVAPPGSHRGVCTAAPPEDLSPPG